ncbi:hypothetical protein LJY25_08525 [Hymenobacter sp. BT175]|uniref:hypothetical protein n=1 Tax=Hymenobacter translucens TaxID=2886507 RepID=UPI001D0E1A8B|nr:hypothetical protein [Hymenobacter translucens]MCC2546485.1 hypothetical protein [Hymenobacter translucens]
MKRSAFPLLLLLLSSCEYFDYRVLTVNKLASRVAVAAEPDTVPTYPSPGQKEFFLRTAIASGDSLALMQPGKYGWPQYLAGSRNHQLHLFIYPVDSILRYGHMDSVIRHRAYKRLTIDGAELQQANWRVLLR